MPHPDCRALYRRVVSEQRCLITTNIQSKTMSRQVNIFWKQNWRRAVRDFVTVVVVGVVMNSVSWLIGGDGKITAIEFVIELVGLFTIGVIIRRIRRSGRLQP
jgi:hypothetical protein